MKLSGQVSVRYCKKPTSSRYEVGDAKRDPLEAVRDILAANSVEAGCKPKK
ncbi:hypothetical protein C1H46_045545 [Malus baccata]|uniref:Uncharacterized protein n=1 Tax=Malus baccata TaxID=106549 RepID=A0A540K4W0_MALBA|nr:hypothetical protein C1H46_045545 [Malus baccata]